MLRRGNLYSSNNRTPAPKWPLRRPSSQLCNPSAARCPKKARRSGGPDVDSAARPIFHLACADHTLRAQGHRSRYPRADSHVRMMGKKKQWRRAFTLFLVGSVFESEYCLKACMICLRPDAICVATLPPVSACLPIRVRFRCQSLRETFAFSAHMCRHGHRATLPPLL